jgi:signal transduction histidine kinase
MTITARAKSTWDSVRSLPPMVLDGALAAFFVVTGLASTAVDEANGILYEPRDAIAYALILLATVPYVARRRAPLAVFFISAIAVVVLTALDYAEGTLPLVVLFGAYTVGAHRPVRDALIAGGSVVVMLLIVFANDDSGFGAADLAANLAMFTSAILIGWNLQSRRLRLAALEKGHEEAARAAAADERLRIAQELHDVVAHSLGVIAVQAGVGLHVIDDQPEEAKRALENISASSRTSLTEIRRLLSVVRDREDAPDYSPAPSLAELPRLVREMEGLGLDIDLAVVGDVVDLPPGVELATYRIVQEALTNALRHAAASSVSVRIERDGDEVEIVVTDDGVGAVTSTAPSGGHGLVGMRERAACYDGDLEAGPLAEGGWRVATRLHIEPGVVA